VINNVRYLLPWVSSLNAAVSDGPGFLCLFLLGLFSSLLFYFAVRLIVVIFIDKNKKNKIWDMHNGARLGMAGSALLLLAGLILNILPLKGDAVFLLYNFIQSFAFIGFAANLFFSVCLASTGKIINVLAGSIAGVFGIGAILAPFFLNLPAAWFIGGYILLLALAFLPFGFLQKDKPKPLTVLLTGCAAAVMLSASLVVPFEELQIALWAIPMIFTLGFWDLLFLSKKTVDEAVLEIPSAGTADEFEELDMVEDHHTTETPAVPAQANIAAYKVNPFIPKEFLQLLNKETVMDLKLGDHHEREMTIFFSDIRKFTDFFESLSPVDGFKFINSYLTRVVPIIEKNGGFVDKYIGDAVMALYPQTNGADMAVKSAIEIQKQMLEYNAQRSKYGYIPLEIGIGIHTGQLMLGVIGVHNRMQNTVISDSVNLASRVEGLTKAFGVTMAISGQTFQKLDHPEAYMFRYLGNVKVKGKGEPTRVYEILDGIDQDIMEKKMQTNRFFEQGLFSFVMKKYDDALDNFNQVLDILPTDQAAIMYREHCITKLKSAEKISA